MIRLLGWRIYAARGQFLAGGVDQLLLFSIARRKAVTSGDGRRRISAGLSIVQPALANAGLRRKSEDEEVCITGCARLGESPSRKCDVAKPQ